MTRLVIWSDSEPDTPLVSTTDVAEITNSLGAAGITFEQWAVSDELASSPSQDEVVATYRREIDRLVDAHGFSVVDVAQIHPTDDPGWSGVAAGARAKFLEEHTHAEHEVRFFVQGSGVFYLHIDGQVFALLCEAGDLVAVPALTTHWFDMGTRPDFTAIRFFVNPDGWVGSFTGDPISQTFPDYDTISSLQN